MITLLEDIGESVIREMTRLAIENNAVNLAQGITRIEPPERLLDFAVEAIKGGFNSYTVTYGRPQLRKKISEIIYNETGVEFDPNSEVLITMGASEGFASSIFSLIEGESSVVIPEPFYESYFPLVALSRGKPIFLKLKKSDYSITKAEIEKLSPYKLFILNSPHNPTGRVFKEKELKLIAESVLEKDAYLLVDETYKYITFENPYISPLSIPEIVDRSIIVGSFSKTFSVTGWRIGYVLAREPIMKGIRKVHDYLAVCAPAPFQWAVEQFKWGEDYLSSLSKIYKEKRDFFMKILKRSGFDFYKPEGAYYIFAGFEGLWEGNDWAFAKFLVKNRRIAVVPGSSFYNDKKAGERKVRFNFALSNEALKIVANRLLAGVT